MTRSQQILSFDHKQKGSLIIVKHVVGLSLLFSDTVLKKPLVLVGRLLAFPIMKEFDLLMIASL